MAIFKSRFAFRAARTHSLNSLLANSFGVPIKQMPGFLDLKSDIQDQTLKNYGIPCDSANNEFANLNLFICSGVNGTPYILLIAFNTFTLSSCLSRLIKIFPDGSTNTCRTLISGILITFFMFCTTLSKPQTMEISMPTNDKVTEEEQNKVKASEAITILLGDNDRVFYYLGEPKYEDYTSLIETSYNADGIRALLLDRNKEVVAKVKDLKERKKREEISEEVFDSLVVDAKKAKGAPVAHVYRFGELTRKRYPPNALFFPSKTKSHHSFEVKSTFFDISLLF